MHCSKRLTATLLLLALWGGLGCSGQTPEAPSEGDSEAVFELPKNTTPWTETVQGYECTHVRVEEKCKDGWCLIPAGCFIMGSPTDEPGYGPGTDLETPVILTRPFVMQQTELTQSDWSELVSNNPSGLSEAYGELPAGAQRDCLEDGCPVGHLNWFEAVAYANLRSEREGLESCYELLTCRGEIGSREEPYLCETVKSVRSSVYECSGYRLPTEFEREYATRAGTRTAFYSGSLPENYSGYDCSDVPLQHLDAIAWYCANANNQSHPVALKLANAWGLFDMTGNAAEWGHSRDVMPWPGEPPWTDPVGQDHEVSTAVSSHRTHGGNISSSPVILRSAFASPIADDFKWAALGVRYVRTLSAAEAEAWQ